MKHFNIPTFQHSNIPLIVLVSSCADPTAAPDSRAGAGALAAGAVTPAPSEDVAVQHVEHCHLNQGLDHLLGCRIQDRGFSGLRV